MKARRSVVVLADLLALLTPEVALANFVWPPALYYYSFTKWWIVVSGLSIEAAVYVFGLKTSVRRAFRVSLVTNGASAALGFVVTWPVVFYERGIELALNSPRLSVLGIVVLIVALNIVVEYCVAATWCSLARSRAVIGNVIVANLLSFALVVVAIPTWFRM